MEVKTNMSTKYHSMNTREQLHATRLQKHILRHSKEERALQPRALSAERTSESIMVATEIALGLAHAVLREARYQEPSEGKGQQKQAP
eukprot:10573459-Alexandrium_andersonii.AAC.1